ncbi:MAG: phosphoenolpyruvate--protein phosphotransferase [Candidatus Omnitrophica bacterium]|nr:phosphoenolpyruvate--protein phosphotransferase [Candidatus Omnitrophota bacterium]
MLVLKGIPASHGIAIGKAFLFGSEEPPATRRSITETEISTEVMRFEEALIQTRHQILDIQRRLADEMGQEHAEIFNAHLLVLEDQSLREEVLGGLKAQLVNVEAIFNDVIRRHLRAFSRTNDEYLRDRTADIEDVRKRILRNLTGRQRNVLEQIDEPVVVVAHALSPSETALMHKRHVLAFVTDVGGRTGHTAIMAKSLGIPAVVGVEVATKRIEKGGRLVVDGTRGEVVVDPDAETIRRYEVEQRRWQEISRQLLQLKDLPAETLDGRRVTLSANLEVPDEIPSVIAHGAEGIGLYRTEFFYMNRTDFPSEEEQFQAYKTVAERMAPQSVIVRTVDLGGDKFLSPLDLPTEMNPFMGWRAIRFCLARPDVFRVQLRAILRASAYGNLKLMFPMISGLEELRRANEILHGVKQELTREKQAYASDLEIGAMIEVPSAALTCDLLAGEVKFFSIGTNDLIQYALAVDRVNEKIAYLYEPSHPAVIRLLKQIIEAGHRAGLWVGMCGEMAGEPALALLLLGLGLDEFSVSPIQVPLIKKVVRSIEYRAAQAIAQHAMGFRTGKEVEAFLISHLRQLVPDLVEG